jgi:hypothetical protein
MANTYTQIYIQIVFAVDGRQNLIPTEHNDELQKYITGIVSAQKHKLIAMGDGPLCMAGRIRGVLVFAFAARRSHSLHR